ncbi:hypothetical protein [Oceanobacillus sp. FSL K6-0251]|uniref:hypothetical protein n=1 Tax=Oceanobacillus sp. FSL K6-0251 TaxID=2921602 RepID=UPI0030FBACCC
MENVAITYVTPEMYGYKDRGVLKWQGMILADHTDALKKELNGYEEVKPKEEMTEDAISEVLNKAFINSYPVLIQANVMQNGLYYKDLQCKVDGYAEGQIHLKLKDGRTTCCILEEIRNVEMMNPLDWYDKLN